MNVSDTESVGDAASEVLELAVADDTHATSTGADAQLGRDTDANWKF